MWCFGRLLPLMIGERISQDNEYWCNFLLLLTIVDYLFAPVLSPDCTSYIKALIDDHHQAWLELYPSCNVTPKMHYMIHYPECIERYGPLVRFWCMRFESKHNYFKQCFKNIPKTMAQRHPKFMCYHLNCENSPFTKETMVGPDSVVDVSSLPYKEKLLEVFDDIVEDSQVTRISWIDIDGTKYHKEGVVVLQSHLLPLFGIIADILCRCADHYYFVCNVLRTECFSSHFHAYKVSKTKEYVLCTHSDLVDHHVLGLYSLSSYATCFIPMKYHLVENIW